MDGHLIRQNLPKATCPKERQQGGKRKEHAADINNGICEFVNNYKIDGGDNVLPKILGLLGAIRHLITSLVPMVK